MSSAILKFACVVGLIFLFVISAASLTSFPTTFDDEGWYALAARNYAENGRYGYWSGTRPVPFDKGDALRSRVNPAAFLALGKIAGYSLKTARIVPFVWIWLSVFLWFFIARALGVPGAMGALLFAATERIFYSSHVFRPEAPLVFFTTLLLFAMVCAKRVGPLARGLLNSTFVLSHGDGIVAAIVNSVDILRQKKARVIALYVVASLAAVFLFYLVQMYDAGGWKAFFGQMHASSQFHPKGGIAGVLWREIDSRWGLELVKVGGSVFAKLLRAFFYLATFSVATFSAVRLKGPARLLGAYALLCLFGFVVFVHDKNDIQIAEMVPFLVGAFLAWVGTRNIRAKIRMAGFLSVLGASLALSVHHGLAYRGPTSFDRNNAQTDRFLDASKGRYKTVVGEAHFWFHFNKRSERFVYWREVESLPRLVGGVLFIGQSKTIAEDLKCQTEYVDPDSIFTAAYCKD